MEDRTRPEEEIRKAEQYEAFKQTFLRLLDDPQVQQKIVTLLSRPACGSRLPPTAELLAQGMHYLHMDGRAVFRWAVGILCDTIQDVLKAAGGNRKQAAEILGINRRTLYRMAERYKLDL